MARRDASRERKGFAAFYTKPPIAAFLATLTVPRARDGFRVCDFACGSGILLRAMQNLLAGRDPELFGFEAQSVPAGRARAVLAGGRAKIRVLSVRSDGLGSLALLTARLPKFDVVIMNPPYARATAPGSERSRPRVLDVDRSSDARDRRWTSYVRLVREVEAEALRNPSIGSLFAEWVGPDRPFRRRNVDPLYAGAALPFFFLADRHLETGGRVALVLPRTALESSSFFLFRAALLSGYRIEWIVTSALPGAPNFSESTQMSEVLLVARKGDGDRPDAARAVTFRRQPRDPAEASRWAKRLLAAQRVPEAPVATIPQSVLAAIPHNFRLALELPPPIALLMGDPPAGALLGAAVRWRRLSELGFAMANPRQFRGREFRRRFPLSRAGPLRVLPATGRRVFRSLWLDGGATVAARAADGRAREFFARHAGRVLVPEAVRFTTTPLVAVRSPRAIASSRAHMLRADPVREKALCAWMDSTFALAFLRASFTTLEAGFGHVYGWHLRTLPVPDLDDPRIAERLAAVFDAHARRTWPALPSQYEGFPPRAAFDRAVLAAVAGTVPPKSTEQLAVLYEAMRDFL